MGSFVGHFVPALALILLGLWHTINTIKAYFLKGSAGFSVKFWYPFCSSSSRLKHLELIFILSFSVVAILGQLSYFPLKLDNFEHATMFLHLIIFAGFALSADITHSSDTLSGVCGLLAASVFGQELFLLHFHSTDHVGLEGHYHWLLQLIVFVSLVSALAVTSFRSSFPAAVLLSISIVFQGCWFMDMGFMLWVPELVPEGCFMQVSKDKINSIQGAVACRSLDADLRARALANLQFSWILAAIFFFTGCACLKFARKCTSIAQSIEYEQLHSKGTDVPMAIDGFNQTHT